MFQELSCQGGLSGQSRNISALPFFFAESPVQHVYYPGSFIDARDSKLLSVKSQLFRVELLQIIQERTSTGRKSLTCPVAD